MLPTILVLVALFALLFVGRVGAARRAEVARRWPAPIFAGAALLLLLRGMILPAVFAAVLAVAAWLFWPRLAAGFAPTAKTPHPDPGEVEARAILGVGPTATESEIRAAYRAKMARAHPDRGGRHADAARLTAARDRLLKNRR